MIYLYMQLKSNQEKGKIEKIQKNIRGVYSKQKGNVRERIGDSK